MTPRHHSLLAGLVLALVGLVFLFHALGLGVLAGLWKAWPLVLVFLGVNRLLRARAGLAPRLAAPERLLLVLVTVAGVAMTLGVHHHPRSARGGSTPPPFVPPAIPRAWTPAADLRAVHELTAELAAGARLDVDVRDADLSIEPGPGPRVTATLLSAPGGSAGLAEALALDSDSGHAAVRFAPPGAATVARQVRIVVPVGTHVVVRHAAGHVRLRQMGETAATGALTDFTVEQALGPIVVEVTNGSFTGSGLTAATTVIARVSNVSIENATAALSIDSRWGDVRVEKALAGLEVRAVAGDVVLDTVSGALRVVASGARIKLQRVLGGSVEVEAHDGTLSAEGLAGSLQVRATACEVQVAGVAGNAEVTTTLRRVVIEGVRGRVVVAASDGDVRIGPCEGSIEVRVERGSARVEAARATVRVTTVEGDAEVTVRSADGGPVEVETTAGDATIALGPGGARIEGNTEHGHIVTKVAGLELHGTGATQSAAGAVRGGSRRVAVAVHDGTLRIED